MEMSIRQTFPDLLSLAMARNHKQICGCLASAFAPYMQVQSQGEMAALKTESSPPTALAASTSS